LLTYFRWTGDVGIAVLEATRPHTELYRVALESGGEWTIREPDQTWSHAGLSRFGICPCQRE
jgi:hypothetical protein